jgi:hypothetical protein
MRSHTRHTGHVVACYALTHKAHGSCVGMLCAHSQDTRVMCWHVMRSLTRHTGHVVVCYALTHKAHGSCGGMLCAHSQGTRVMWWYAMRSLTRHTGMLCAYLQRCTEQGWSFTSARSTVKKQFSLRSGPISRFSFARSLEVRAFEAANPRLCSTTWCGVDLRRYTSLVFDCVLHFAIESVCLCVRVLSG